MPSLMAFMHRVALKKGLDHFDFKMMIQSSLEFKATFFYPSRIVACEWPPRYSLFVLVGSTPAFLCKQVKVAADDGAQQHGALVAS